MGVRVQRIQPSTHLRPKLELIFARPLSRRDHYPLADFHFFGQNRHHLIGATGGQRTAPVVGLGVVELMQ